jgi:GntR family transcriptional regulator
VSDTPTVAGDRYLPRYRAIEQALRARVAALEPGDPLPSDAELCAEFGVSRMTARNAVQRLVEEGLVSREPGRGSYVAVPPSHRRANSLMSFSEEMRRQGRVPHSRLLRREIRPPTPAEARDLRLRDGDAVVALVRVRLADAEPLAIEAVVLQGACAAAALGSDLETGSLHEALAAAGFVPSRGRATISAEAAGDEDARLLGVATGSPLLVERRVIVDLGGRPLETTTSRYPADRYALDVDFEVEAARERASRRRTAH